MHTHRLLSSRLSRLLLLAFALPICASWLAGCATQSANSAPLSGHVKITGSTALQPLVTQAAQLFQQLHPGVQITVAGGGSKQGLKDANSHASDIGDSDIYADPAIYPDPNLTDHLVCLVPFVIIINPNLTISSLKLSDIIGIFSTGTITNWKQVGGPDLPIQAIVRPSSSGTRATFRRYVLGGRDQLSSLPVVDSSQTVHDTVAKTPGSISYVGSSYLDAAIRSVGIDGYQATKDNITSGKYSFWSYEHMYTLNIDEQGPAQAFLDFMTQSTVQRLAQQLGYIPIADMKLSTLPSGAGSVGASFADAARRESEGHYAA